MSPKPVKGTNFDRNFAVIVHNNDFILLRLNRTLEQTNDCRICQNRQ